MTEEHIYIVQKPWAVKLEETKLNGGIKCENGENGENGLLDRPSEVCRRGNRLYISNIDLPGGDNAFDAPHNISVIGL